MFVLWGGLTSKLDIYYIKFYQIYLYSSLNDFDILKFWSLFSVISLPEEDSLSRSNSTGPFPLTTSARLDLNWIFKGSSPNLLLILCEFKQTN